MKRSYWGLVTAMLLVAVVPVASAGNLVSKNQVKVAPPQVVNSPNQVAQPGQAVENTSIADFPFTYNGSLITDKFATDHGLTCLIDPVSKRVICADTPEQAEAEAGVHNATRERCYHYSYGFQHSNYNGWKIGIIPSGDLFNPTRKSLVGTRYNNAISSVYVGTDGGLFTDWYDRGNYTGPYANFWDIYHCNLSNVGSSWNDRISSIESS